MDQHDQGGAEDYREQAASKGVARSVASESEFEIAQRDCLASEGQEHRKKKKKTPQGLREIRTRRKQEQRMGQAQGRL